MLNKILILTSIILTLMLGGLLVITSKQKSVVSKYPLTSTPITPTIPIIPTVKNEAQEVSHAIGLINPPQNLNLEVLHTQPTNLLYNAQAAAQALGFSGEPTLTEFTKIYEWRAGENRLTYNPTAQLITFIGELHYFSNSPDKIPLLNNLVFEQMLVPTDYSLVLSHTRHLKTAGLHAEPATAQTADLISYQYSFFVNNTPVLINPNSTSSISITLNREGVLVFLSLYLPPQIHARQNVGLITAAQAQKLLTTGYGLLIEGSLIETFYPENNYNFITNNINHWSPAYLYNQDQNILIPSYLFFGSSQDTNNHSPLQTTHLVPAVSP